MIQNVTPIASPYSKPDDKVNDISTLDAREWNDISAAVETAHAKINKILNEKITYINLDLVSGDNDLKIEGPNAVIVCPEDSIMLNPGTSLSGGRIDIGGTNTSDVYFSKIGSGSISLSDLMTIVNFFKADTSTGPFASAA